MNINDQGFLLSLLTVIIGGIFISILSYIYKIPAKYLWIYTYGFLIGVISSSFK